MTDVERENLGLFFSATSKYFFTEQHLNHLRPHTMATSLGKRKRRTVDTTKEDRRHGSADSESEETNAQELFRRHFEAKFKPLPVVKKVETVVVEVASEDDSEEESDWDGISDHGEGAVEVVEHADTQSRMALMSKEELKVFMVWRFPREDEVN
jgi:hypothetical protein